MQLDIKFRLLISYWYYKNVDLDEMLEKYFPDYEPDIFADSGAFSAMTQGHNVNINAYAKWIKRYEHRFTAYANLDVIKDAENTWKNQQILEDKYALSPVPVFHVLEDFNWLEHYLDRYRYIALGVAGMQYRRNAIMAWLTKCFEMGDERVSYHGFGLTSWKVMRSFPWYSVDSSSWGQGFRFGVCPVFDSNVGRFVKVKLGDVKSCLRHANLLTRYGYDPEDFYDRERNDRTKIASLSALSYMQAEQYLRNLWKETKKNKEGIRIFLADSGGINNNYYQAKEGIKLYLVDTTNGTNFDLGKVWINLNDR